MVQVVPQRYRLVVRQLALDFSQEMEVLAAVERVQVPLVHQEDLVVVQVVNHYLLLQDRLVEHREILVAAVAVDQDSL
jgi:hypothetical protein